MTRKKINIPTSNIVVTKKKIPISKDQIELLKKRRDEKIQFSFAMLDLTHEYFNLATTCNRWGQLFMETMNELSKLTKVELVSGAYEHRFRPHQHKWNELKLRFNIENLELYETRQISLGSSSGRIHGLFIGNVFYIVWLDPNHYLYHNDRYGPIKSTEPPMSCCEQYKKQLDNSILEHELKIEVLQREIEDYKTIFDEI